jgi:hypothetical protein
MNAAQRTAITAPAKGLLVFDNSSNNFWFYNGVAWMQLGGAINSNNGWGLNGNTGNADTNFIGTTDNQPLRVRVNNSWAGAIHPTSGNLFLGMGAGKANTTGASNTAIGEHALFANADGNFNTANGNYALATNTTGLYNAALGSNALRSNTSGGSNVAVGAGTMYNNTTGLYNTANGAAALYYSKTASYNTASGAQALYNDSTGSYNTASGYLALFFNNAEENTAIGATAMQFNTTGYQNTAIGSRAMVKNKTGFRNTAVGVTSLATNTTGNGNTALGCGALDFNQTGSSNTATGYGSLSHNNAGTENTADGYQALYNNTTGNYNSALGFGALAYNTGGNYNIAIGHGAGVSPGSPNTFNTISIGNDDYLNGYQNQAFIGNTSTGWIGGKVTWSTFSDARIKNSIAEDVKGLDFILKLRPVTYHISNKAIVRLSGNKETPDFPGKYDSEKIKYSGFLAQEVEKAAKESHYEFSGYAAPKNKYQLYTLSYEQFVVPLVKAVQDQQKMIEVLKKQVASATMPVQTAKQQLTIADQQKHIELLEKRLAALEKNNNAAK